jgi:hypothetical protein
VGGGGKPARSFNNTATNGKITIHDISIFSILNE